MTRLRLSPEAPVIDEGPRTGPADALVLDIGGDVGALILYTDDDLIGTEISLTPVGVDHDDVGHHGVGHRHNGVHTAIRRRRATDRDIVCGVYPELHAGTYTVWGLGGDPIATVRIEGGRVSEISGGNCRAPES